MSYLPILRPFAQCRNRLIPGREPVRPWPVPAINGLALTADSSDWLLDYVLPVDSPNYQQDWAQLFHATQSDLSWFELLELMPRIEKLAAVEASVIWTAFGFRTPDPRLLIAVAQIPDSIRPTIHHWMSAKKVGPMDLLPLLSVEPHFQKLDLFWPHLEKLSRQDGVKALELWVELSLAGEAMDALQIQSTESAGQWLDRLKSKRYPQTTLRDSMARQWLETQSWPRGLQMRWQRQGDQSGIELKVNLRRPQDLSGLAKNISSLEEKLNSAPEALWPKN